MEYAITLLALHARQLPRSRSRLLPCHPVLEPQDVRNKRGVAQHKELAESPRHNVRKVLRQHQMRDAKPGDAKQDANAGAIDNLLRGVVQQVGAAD